MLATTAAAGLPFVEVKDAKLNTPTTTSTHAFKTGSTTTALPAAPALVKRPSHSTLPPPTRSTPSTLPPSGTSTTSTQARHRVRVTKAASPGLAKSLIFTAWDWLWRQWYALIATWGISVMEPWERVFTLVLLGSLVALFGVALVKTPAYVQHAAKRLAYYLFGSHSRRAVASTVASSAAKVNGANETAAWLQLGAASPVKGDPLAQCQQALAGLVRLNASGGAVGGAEGLMRAWTQAT